MGDIAFARYRERLGLTYEQACQEPYEEIARMLFIWSLDDERDKLEAKRQEAKARRS